MAKEKQLGFKIAEDGTVTLLTPKGAKLVYDELREGVGNYIASVELKAGQMWVDDEGLLNGRQYNRVASDVMWYTRKYPEQESYLCGDVAFIPHKKFNWDAMPSHLADMFRTLLAGN